MSSSPPKSDASIDSQSGLRYRAWYQRGTETPVTAVVKAVACASQVDATELEPLYTAIDPSALNALFERSGSRSTRDWELTFRYAEHTVTIASTGEITVYQAV
ncbi:hypothetical protein QA600_02460 [Natronococcus sp. A-GB1]|uniref:HalOD1 output domain-containing protein n=1 Tax=Natronococcus sp. A-GB1 TaxID=3037648 RepID=UPI00241EFDA1|nr:HalOD1 output domain-containing protein [Natronococcus sp. A-GB1]MDG5758197.1 hypothetical protein [Natronococcus sp. A-GB1]